MSLSTRPSLRVLPLPLAVAFATLAAACGGSSASSTFGPDASASAASPPVSAADDAGTTEKDGGPSVLTPKDGGPTVDASPADRRLDPIEVGRVWTYNVQVLGFYPSCENGLGVATTLSKSTKDGKTAFKVQSLCKNAGTFEYAIENDRVYYHHLGEWRLATDEPVVAGHEWSDDTYDYVWEDAGTMTVAAGTFTDCWTAKRKLPYDSFTTFCRGVGPVQWHYEDGLGNGYDAVLASKNF